LRGRNQPCESDLQRRYEAIFRTLESYRATSSLKRLLNCPGIDEHELLLRLTNFKVYSPQMEPQKYRKRQASADCKMIRDTADLIERLNKPYGPDLQGESWRLTEALPDLLRSFARRVEALPEYVAEKWEPIKVAAISQFVWYVKQKTGSYHEEDVSAVVGAFLYNGQWTQDAFHQWRTRHARDIESLGPLTFLPVLPRPPRK
jgi:hypothetical protein